MNGKKARALRDKAHNLWETGKPKTQKKISKRKAYKILKKKYKNGEKVL